MENITMKEVVDKHLVGDSLNYVIAGGSIKDGKLEVHAQLDPALIVAFRNSINSTLDRLMSASLNG